VPEQIALSSAVLSEFLATEISEEHLKPGKGADETIRAANAIGGGLLDRLEKEFTNGGTVSPDSGAAAARTFAGYGVNFAVQNTIISTLADAVSFHLLEEFRELGVEVAQNIGLGRLVRQALRPLVDTTITKPYTRQLNAKYRQDLMTETHAVHAFLRGAKTNEQIHQELAWRGYTDADIDQLVIELTPHLTESELALLVRFGEITTDDAIGELVAQGVTTVTAQRRLRAQYLQDTLDEEKKYADLVQKQVVDGFLDLETYNVLVDRTHLNDAEKQWRRDYIGQTLETGSKRSTLAQTQNQLLGGIINFGDATDFLAKEGYTVADQENLFLQMLQALSKDQAKKAAAAAKAKQPNTRKPTLAQIKGFYKEGRSASTRPRQQSWTSVTRPP
jgi:hypothetical protein